MTAISTILSVVMLPLNLLLYTHFTYEEDVVKNLDWKSLFVALLVVISAIFIGLYCSYNFKSKRFHKGANAVCHVMMRWPCSGSAASGLSFFRFPSPQQPRSSEILQVLR